MANVVPLRAPEPDERTQALRREFAAGDPDAFEILVRPHLDTLYTFCLRTTGRSEDAWDLAQDSLVRARRKAKHYDPARPLRPWLIAIARNLWRSRLRSPWHRLRTTIASWVPGASPDPGPDREIEARDTDAKVRRALSTLPPIYLEAVALFHLQDMTYAEMSEITGVTVAALKQRVRRGDLLLSEKIAELYPELLPKRT